MFTRTSSPQHASAGPRANLLGAAVLTIAAACLPALAGCHATTASPPAAVSPSTVPPTTPSTTPTSAGTHTYRYVSTKKGCDLIQLDALAATLGPDAGILAPANFERNAIASFARCTWQYGAIAARSLVDIQIMAAGSAATTAAFYGQMRDADAKDDSVTAVPGLSVQGAYLWADQDTGTHLIMYDGNLYLRISINQVTRHDIDAATINSLLAAIARNAMTAMAG